MIEAGRRFWRPFTKNGAARLRSTRRADLVAEAGTLVFLGRAAVGQCVSVFHTASLQPALMLPGRSSWKDSPGVKGGYQARRDTGGAFTSGDLDPTMEPIVGRRGTRGKDGIEGIEGDEMSERPGRVCHARNPCEPACVATVAPASGDGAGVAPGSSARRATGGAAGAD